LIGAIWQVRDNLSFDVGIRHGLTNDRAFNEVRAGMTFGFPLRQMGSMDHRLK
jgi:long-subunit fatty acid transport protein